MNQDRDKTVVLMLLCDMATTGKQQKMLKRTYKKREDGGLGTIFEIE